MKRDAFTLTEALVALSLLGVVLAALAPAFVGNLETNRTTDDRATSVSAARQVLEQLRASDVDTLPGGGTQVYPVEVGARTLDVEVTFCHRSDHCDATSRSVRVEVKANGRARYATETVFTSLR